MGATGRVTVRLAMSLDGYIADADGGYGWIVPVPSPGLGTDRQIPFDDFLHDVDLVVMGRRCFDEGAAADYVELGKRVVVATSSPLSIDGGVDVEATDDVLGLVSAARDAGEHCFLFGGGLLVHSFLAADLVDGFTIGVVPVVLGGGRRLFPGEHPPRELRLVDYTVGDGKVRLVYERR